MNLLDVVTGPWAIAPEMLLEIQAIYAAHVRGDQIDLAAVEARLGHPLNNEHKPYTVQDGVAHIELSGVLAKRGNLFSNVSGMKSMQMMGKEIAQAARDPAVKAILLAVDSPGGTVDGTQALAALVAEAAQIKPTVAWADGQALSAGYWIASAADAIYAGADTSALGSIGVVATHKDLSAAEAKLGVKTTEITAGRYKRIAGSYEPLSTEGRADIQAKVDALYSIFADAVAANRGASIETVLSDMADGRVFLARDAVNRGLADGILSLQQVHDGLASGELGYARRLKRPLIVSTARAVAASATPTSKGAHAMDLATLRAEHPDLAQSLIDEGFAQGKAEGKAEGATAERKRIQSVRDMAAGLPGHEALVQTLMFDGTTTAEMAAVKILAAEKAGMANMAAALHNEAPQPAPHATAPSDAPAALPEGASVEDRAKAQWDASADLRAEFGNRFATYLAYANAQQKGAVKMLGGKRAA